MGSRTLVVYVVARKVWSVNPSNPDHAPISHTHLPIPQTLSCLGPRTSSLGPTKPPTHIHIRRYCLPLILTNNLYFRHTVTSLPTLLPAYHRSLHLHKELLQDLRDYDATFEASRDAIASWVSQPYLADDGWSAAWEDLCAVEVDRWELAR